MSIKHPHTTIKVVVLSGPVQLKSGSGGRPQSSIRTGEAYDGYIKEGWLYLPDKNDVGLSLKEWRQKWDDLKVDVYRSTGGRFVKLTEEKDWDQIEKGPVRG